MFGEHSSFERVLAHKKWLFRTRARTHNFPSENERVSSGSMFDTTLSLNWWGHSLNTNDVVVFITFYPAKKSQTWTFAAIRKWDVAFIFNIVWTKSLAYQPKLNFSLIVSPICEYCIKNYTFLQFTSLQIRTSTNK